MLARFYYGLILIAKRKCKDTHCVKATQSLRSAGLQLGLVLKWKSHSGMKRIQENILNMQKVRMKTPDVVDAAYFTKPSMSVHTQNTSISIMMLQWDDSVTRNIILPLNRSTSFADPMQSGVRWSTVLI
jgi:hypothetical protein